MYVLIVSKVIKGWNRFALLTIIFVISNISAIIFIVLFKDVKVCVLKIKVVHFFTFVFLLLWISVDLEKIKAMFFIYCDINFAEWW